MNNIGLINSTVKFSRTIGQTINVTNPSLINSISGSMDVGFIAFDVDGTMAVCTSFTRDQQDNPIYTFKTTSLNTEIDITNILSQSY